MEPLHAVNSDLVQDLVSQIMRASQDAQKHTPSAAWSGGEEQIQKVEAAPNVEQLPNES